MDTSNPTLRPKPNASNAIQKNLAPLMNGVSLAVAGMAGVAVLMMFAADAANLQTGHPVCPGRDRRISQG